LVLKHHPPILFVHGNGDTAALWHTTIWRFESNGWPRAQLHAIDLPYPVARDEDHLDQPGRSSSEQHMRFLAAEVERVLEESGESRLVLVANSRGGYAVRNYIAHGGGAARVSHAILGGTPNHGVWAIPDYRPQSEFNGAGPFLRRLNSVGGSVEVTPGVAWLTLRSDDNDKYAQPHGDWIGHPGLPTHVLPSGPALKGATNLVLPGHDHREVSFSAAAFDHTWRFITGHAPTTVHVVDEMHISLNGKVSGLGVDNQTGSEPNNLPLAGAILEVYEVNPATGERLGPSVHRATVGPDGRWGPMKATTTQAFEFVIFATGYAITHLYRSPFARSSQLVNLRAERLPAAQPGMLACVMLTRPRGYFDLERDHCSLDGPHPHPDVPPGTAGVSVAVARIADKAHRAVVGEFNGERIVGRAWPLAGNHVVLLELHH
jgi:pimeloyl-ACP methyl ester carboxylesterase